MNHLIFEQFAQLGILTINRPSVLNSLNQSTLQELLAFVRSPTLQIRALIITGAGPKAFVAGADIAEMQALTASQMLDFCKLGQHVTSALEQAPFLTLAAVNGYALGGGLELALGCDLIFAAGNAKLGLPEVSLGLIPGFGGTQRLTRSVGQRRAKDLILTGRTFTAQEGVEWGLVNKICEPEKLLDESKAYLNKILENPQTALLQAKYAIDYGQGMELSSALELERNMCAVCFSTPERLDRMTTFLERAKK